MANKMEQRLDEAIEQQFDKLATMDGKDEGYKTEVDTLADMCRLKIDAAKATEGRWMQIAKLGVDIATVVLPLGFYGLWMKRGFEFEKTGTFTSNVFRGLFNKFRPTK